MFDFSPYAAVLLDLDGTVYHEHTVVPGAADLIRRLQKSGQTLACLSNSTASPGQLVVRLASMDIQLPKPAIYTALAAAAEHVLREWKRPRIFNLATEGLVELLDGRVDWVDSIDDRCDAVIAGAPANTFARLDRQQKALELLRRGAALVGVCADRVYPSPRGLELGSGALCAMLAYAANKSPIYCGKPEPEFFLGLCNRLNVRPADCILIGDNLESDIAGARRVGIKTILVMTGVTTPQDLAAIADDHRADHVANSLCELL